MAKRRRTARPAPGAPPVGTRARRRSPEPERRLPWLRLVVIGVVVVGVVGFVGLAFLNSATARAYTCDELLTPPANASSDGFTPDSLGSQHVGAGTKIRYGFCPPTSGGHYNAAGVGPLRPGFYGPDADAGPGGWVHNLEHGYVVALYRCTEGTCPSEADLAALREFAANGPPTNRPRPAATARKSSSRGSTRWRRHTRYSPGTGRSCSMGSTRQSRGTSRTAPSRRQLRSRPHAEAAHDGRARPWNT